MLRQKENVLFLVHAASVYRGTMNIIYIFFLHEDLLKRGKQDTKKMTE